MSARAAEEEKAQGKKQITPWWRTIKSDGSLNEKYPGNIAFQKKILTKERHHIITKGKRTLVENYEEKLKKF